MKSPCEEKGWKVGEVFEVVNESKACAGHSKEGTTLVLDEDDLSGCPWFIVVAGPNKGARTCPSLGGLKRIYPPEEESKDVTVACEGKETTWCRRDAKRMGLI